MVDVSIPNKEFDKLLWKWEAESNKLCDYVKLFEIAHINVWRKVLE